MQNLEMQIVNCKDLWGRISRFHLSSGSKCACHFGGLTLQGLDFELDIVEHIVSKAKSQNLVLSLKNTKMHDLFNALTAFQNSLDIEILLNHLSTTLNSINQAHQNGRYKCS